jgi:hypothetical protein|uniref:hypothetical protein n=1 Tax=Pseudomonas aeruginosa TaxID=287 RepID=UPI0004033653|nr:hypothetical protein [Pseudomonas aeruginosa]
MVFSLLAPDEVSTSGIVAVEVNGQHNEASCGFKPRRAFFGAILPAFSFLIFGNESGVMVKKNQWFIKPPGLQRPIFGGKLAPDIWM